MHADIEKVLVSEKEIDEITTRLAAQIDEDYKDSGKRLILLCILKGSIVFMGDLMKKIKLPVEIDCNTDWQRKMNVGSFICNRAIGSETGI